MTSRYDALLNTILSLLSDSFMLVFKYIFVNFSSLYYVYVFFFLFCFVHITVYFPEMFDHDTL